MSIRLDTAPALDGQTELVKQYRALHAQARWRAIKRTGPGEKQSLRQLPATDKRVQRTGCQCQCHVAVSETTQSLRRVSQRPRGIIAWPPTDCTSPAFIASLSSVALAFALLLASAARPCCRSVHWFHPPPRRSSIEARQTDVGRTQPMPTHSLSVTPTLISWPFKRKTMTMLPVSAI